MKIMHWSRLALACIAPLMLSACLLTPGKFESSLDIRADRSFTFAYNGEVIASDPDDAMKGMKADEEANGDDEADGTDSAYFQQIALPVRTRPIAKNGKSKGGDEDFAPKPSASDIRMRAIAAALMKEKGFRSAIYKGDGKFLINYAITGTLTHAFLWPFNSDAQAVFPFIAVELRGNDRVRVKAPGYANTSKTAGDMGSSDPDAADALDGRFTLTTDAEIVSHNQEDGPAQTTAGRQLTWKVDPLTSEAPTAVIRFPAR